MSHANAAGFGKSQLRERALSSRDALPVALRAEAAEVVAARPLPIDVQSHHVVSAYWPMRSEFSPLLLMHRIADRGIALALPVVVGRGRPLTFRRWTFGEPLDRGVWGIREPMQDAQEVLPDILIVPLAAFDRSGHRIGYGAGYYDKTLSFLRERKSIVAIGLGYAAQEIDHVPSTANDARLDWVMTERGVIDCRRT
jgi:5-formyltetrahydrofolate cyclo-ligase